MYAPPRRCEVMELTTKLQIHISHDVSIMFRKDDFKQGNLFQLAFMIVIANATSTFKMCPAGGSNPIIEQLTSSKIEHARHSS